jgi:hypothetical protein
MRSSPNFLVVNRSEGVGDDGKGESPEGGLPYTDLLQPRHDEVDISEVDIRLRVSYRTILMVFVAFNVGNRVVNALSSLFS